MTTPKTHKQILRAEQIAQETEEFSHPWNPNSTMRGAVLARRLGLKRLGVNLGRLPPGRESFAPHSHAYEEEWVYVISGKGIASIDGEDYELNAGDFAAFPVPSVVHQLRNPFGEELVYLM